MSLEGNFYNQQPDPRMPANSVNYSTNYNSLPASPSIPNNGYLAAGAPYQQGGALVSGFDPAAANLPRSSSVQSLQSASRKKRNSGFLGVLGLLVIVLILLGATVLGIVVVVPQSEVAQRAREIFLNQKMAPGSEPNSDNSNPETTTLIASNTKQNTASTSSNRNDVSPFTFAKPEGAKTVVEVVEKVLPSVLSINVGQNQFRQGVLVSGTGYIVSETGLVVTNKHVISPKCQFGSDVEILATDQNNRVFELKLLTVDPIYDIAILQIQDPPENLLPVKFADSENLKLGTEVIAIGNALGQLQNTVTSGVVSGLSRNVTTDLVDECTNSPVFADGLIQTDAAINRGNSGGPLFNAAGQLVGMNTFGTLEAENIGLAIPSAAIVSALNSYRENGIITRPKLGVFSQTITPLLKEKESWLPVDYGEIIVAPTGQTAVERGSAADVAGLKEGDIILEINDLPIRSTQNNPSPLRRVLLRFKPGDNVKLKVLKTTGKTSTGFSYAAKPVVVPVTLGSVVFKLR